MKKWKTQKTKAKTLKMQSEKEQETYKNLEVKFKKVGAKWMSQLRNQSGNNQTPSLWFYEEDKEATVENLAFKNDTTNLNMEDMKVSEIV